MKLAEQKQHLNTALVGSDGAAASYNAPQQAASATATSGFGRCSFLQAPFDTIGPSEMIATLRQRQLGDPFVYVVTPNVDHVVRLARRPDLMPAYRAAWLSCCDSQPLRVLARAIGQRLTHLTGADLVRKLFAQVLRPGDRLVCITADDALVDELRARFPQYQFIGYSPPVGFENDPQEMAACVGFVCAHSARFVFLGVGSPRSELLAHAIHQTRRATGTALCIGAALEFLVDRKPRAPRAMRAVGLEWLHRLICEPRRLWRRYTFAAVPLCTLFFREILARRKV